MVSDMWEVLDASIVVLFDPAATVTPDTVRALFAAGGIASHFENPVITQGLLLDPTGGTTPTFEASSMRSQKTIEIGALRLDVHDRAAGPQIEGSVLPSIIVEASKILGAKGIKAIGANFEMKHDLDDMTAAKAIAQKVFRNNMDFARGGLESLGGAARFYFADDSGSTYMLMMEPRRHDTGTKEVWMNINAQLITSGLPSTEVILQVFTSGYRVISDVARTLFS